MLRHMKESVDLSAMLHCLLQSSDGCLSHCMAIYNQFEDANVANASVAQFLLKHEQLL